MQLLTPDDRGRLLPLVEAAADGLSGGEVAERLGISRTHAYRLLARPEVKAQVEAEVAWRRAVSERYRQRHLARVWEYAARVACGEAEVRSPEQLQMILLFTGPAYTGEPGQPAQAQALAGAQIHVHVEPPAVPRVVDGDG